MRTKKLLLTAALSAAVGTGAMAQDVFSVNAVGYINVAVPPGFSIISNQLDSGDNTLASLIPVAPDGTTVYKFNNETGLYEVFAYDDLDEAWVPHGNATLNPGEGAFIRNVTASDITVTFVGEVPQGNLVTPLPTGFSIVGSQVPQAGLVSALGLTDVVDGDTVYQFNNETGLYVVSAFDDLDEAWVPSEPEIQVGEGFFIRKIAAGSWTRQFSVN